jgi:aminoglycoside 3-N-acetyltransferase
MMNFRTLVKTFQTLDLPDEAPVIVQGAPAAFSDIDRGLATLVGALVSVFPKLLTPAFTSQTMVIPKEGPPNNGLDYRESERRNPRAVFFDLDLPVSPELGDLAEAIRQHPRSQRSRHPILSFAGFGVEEILEEQSLSEPLGPIGALYQRGGWSLLLERSFGEDVCIHYGEQLAGRKQFTRWALTPLGVKECPHIPGCSAGFSDLDPVIQAHARQEQVRETTISAVPLETLIPLVKELVRDDPAALLCSEPACARCGAVRKQVQGQVVSS